MYGLVPRLAAGIFGYSSTALLWRIDASCQPTLDCTVRHVILLALHAESLPRGIVRDAAG
jgi:hypothetical protein